MCISGEEALLIFFSFVLSNVETCEMEAGESQSQSGLPVAVSRYSCKSRINTKSDTHLK